MAALPMPDMLSEMERIQADFNRAVEQMEKAHQGRIRGCFNARDRAPIAEAVEDFGLSPETGKRLTSLHDLFLRFQDRIVDFLLAEADEEDVLRHRRNLGFAVRPLGQVEDCVPRAMRMLKIIDEEQYDKRKGYLLKQIGDLIRRDTSSNRIAAGEKALKALRVEDSDFYGEMKELALRLFGGLAHGPPCERIAVGSMILEAFEVEDSDFRVELEGLARRLFRDENTDVWRSGAYVVGRLAGSEDLRSDLEACLKKDGRNTHEQRHAFAALGGLASVDPGLAFSYADRLFNKRKALNLDNRWVDASFVFALPSIFALDPDRGIDYFRKLAAADYSEDVNYAIHNNLAQVALEILRDAKGDREKLQILVDAIAEWHREIFWTLQNNPPQEETRLLSSLELGDHIARIGFHLYGRRMTKWADLERVSRLVNGMDDPQVESVKEVISSSYTVLRETEQDLSNANVEQAIEGVYKLRRLVEMVFESGTVQQAVDVLNGDDLGKGLSKQLELLGNTVIDTIRPLMDKRNRFVFRVSGIGLLGQMYDAQSSPQRRYLAFHEVLPLVDVDNEQISKEIATILERVFDDVYYRTPEGGLGRIRESLYIMLYHHCTAEVLKEILEYVKEKGVQEVVQSFSHCLDSFGKQLREIFPDVGVYLDSLDRNSVDVKQLRKLVQEGEYPAVGSNCDYSGLMQRLLARDDFALFPTDSKSQDDFKGLLRDLRQSLRASLEYRTQGVYAEGVLLNPGDVRESTDISNRDPYIMEIIHSVREQKRENRSLANAWDRDCEAIEEAVCLYPRIEFEQIPERTRILRDLRDWLDGIVKVIKTHLFSPFWLLTAGVLASWKKAAEQERVRLQSLRERLLAEDEEGLKLVHFSVLKGLAHQEVDSKILEKDLVSIPSQKFRHRNRQYEIYILGT